MKTISIWSITTLLILSTLSFSQSNFNINAYKQFLQSHQNLEPDQLMQMHPVGSFIGDLNSSVNNIRYLDSISNKFGLTDYETSLLEQNGFVVSERMKKISFGEAFLEIFHRDMPVFVSTDAILHAFHISYDRILKDAELGFLIDKVKSLLQTLHSQQGYLNTKYSNNSQMMTMLKDVDVYLTVPLKLFELNVSPYYLENEQTINDILQMIEAEEMDTYPLFADVCRVIDWSQFKPRGHYYEDPSTPIPTDLPKYFRVMMWLGRTELYLTQPNSDSILCPLPSFNDIKRQIIDSYLIKELIDHANAYDDYSDLSPQKRSNC